MSNNHYMDLYKEMQKNRRDYNDRLWETAKFITTIFTAIIAVTLSLVSFLYTKNDYKITIDLTFNSLFLIPLALLSIAFGVSCLGWKNFKRENARLYEIIAILGKIENKLCLHKKREESEEKDILFPKDKYDILPNGWVESVEGIESTDKFVDKMFDKTNIDKYGRFYFDFRWLFRLYVAVSIMLILFFVFLGFR